MQEFWEKGGSLVLFAESDELTYQSNEILARLRFPDDKKTNLKLGENHVGEKFLKGDRSGKLGKPGVFNKANVMILLKFTISFAPDDKSIYEPFVPFMKDSDNGISALFYQGDNPETGDPRDRRGDITVDCGYTKLFTQLTEKGTYRSIQNIAAWTAQ